MVSMTSAYDRAMYRTLLLELYGQGGFFNYGYWSEETQTQAEACQNLMEKVLAFLPDRQGSILDVACGMGGSTRELLRHYSPGEVVGINISVKQLQTSRTNAPGADFIMMDATRLAFPDGQFDNMACIEAAFHFNTREGFLHEANRVLKPGGRLVMTDILFIKAAGRLRRDVPMANYVRDIEAYRDMYRRAGFQDVEIVEATKECWIGFRQHLMRWLREKARDRERGPGQPGRLRILAASVLIGMWVAMLRVGIRHYVLVSAKKA